MKQRHKAHPNTLITILVSVPVMSRLARVVCGPSGWGGRRLEQPPRQPARLEGQIVVVVPVIVHDVRGVAVVAQRHGVVPEHSVPVTVRKGRDVMVVYAT